MEQINSNFEDEVISIIETKIKNKIHPSHPDIQEIYTDFLEIIGLAWWIEVITQNPNCTYYFGLFISANSARIEQDGYVEDLSQEGAIIFRIKIKRCRPKVLTICQEEE